MASPGGKRHSAGEPGGTAPAPTVGGRPAQSRRAWCDDDDPAMGPWFGFVLHDRVPARAFAPRPGVDGGILAIHRRGQPLLPPAQRRQFHALVHRVYTGPGRGLTQILAPNTTLGPSHLAAAWLVRHRIAATALPKDLPVEARVDLFQTTGSSPPRCHPDATLSNVRGDAVDEHQTRTTRENRRHLRSAIPPIGTQRLPTLRHGSLPRIPNTADACKGLLTRYTYLCHSSDGYLADAPGCHPYGI